MADTRLPKERASLNEMDAASVELKNLFCALSSFFPMIIYVNLTQNTYKILEYNSFTTRKANTSGIFDDLIHVGMSTVDPVHKQMFFDTFSRDSLLKAYARGETSVVLDVRQLGDDGISRWIKTSVIFIKNHENDDVIEITLSRPITSEKVKELENSRLRSVIEMVMLSKYEYISLIDIRTGKYTLYADAGRNTLRVPSSGDYQEQNLVISRLFVSDSDREDYLKITQLDNLVDRLKRNGGNFSTRFRFGDTSERRWRETMYQYCISDDEEILLTIRDIHDEVTAEEIKKEKEHQQILQGLGSDAPIGIIKCDIDGNITYANKNSADILGSPSIAETMKINLLTFPLLVEHGFADRLRECLTKNNTIVSDVDYVSKWGKKVFLRVHIKTWLEEGRINGAQVIIDDISEIKHLEEELRNISTTDFLTNIYNRRFFLNQLENEIERTKRQGAVFSLIMFDLDHFKNVNDRFGHQAGDIVLKCVADIAKKSMRKIDCFARWGGEEFIILMPCSKIDQARVSAERLCQIISETDMPNIGHVTASFGVTQFNDNDTVDTIIQKADELTYLAKSRGRNQVAY
jgi:diguanylate cyclase (GGDEF)-like protein/PAS domain S-box-containing protein